MTSHTPSPDRLEELREQIARIVDPKAWEKLAGRWRYRDWHSVQTRAIAKADAILALIRPELEARAGGAGGDEPFYVGGTQVKSDADLIQFAAGALRQLVPCAVGLGTQVSDARNTGEQALKGIEQWEARRIS